jgi:hypothetical protein
MTDTTPEDTDLRDAVLDAAPAPQTIALMVQKYITLRDRKKTLKAKFDSDVEAIDEGLSRAEAFFARQMEKQGLESLPTEFGVPYKTTRTSCSVSDGNAFFAFCRDNDLWELLDKRAAKAAVEAYKNEHNDLPPGLNWHAETVINVRRK